MPFGRPRKRCFGCPRRASLVHDGVAAYCRSVSLDVLAGGSASGADDHELQWAGASIARSYKGRGLPLDDLIQSGYVAVIHAVDPSTRAGACRCTPTQRSRSAASSCTCCATNRGSFAGREACRSQALEIAVLGEDLAQRLGRAPTLSEIAAAAGLSVAEVREAIAARTAVNANPMPGSAELLACSVGFYRIPDPLLSLTTSSSRASIAPGHDTS